MFTNTLSGSNLVSAQSMKMVKLYFAKLEHLLAEQLTSSKAKEGFEGECFKYRRIAMIPWHQNFRKQVQNINPLRQI